MGQDHGSNPAAGRQNVKNHVSHRMAAVASLDDQVHAEMKEGYYGEGVQHQSGTGLRHNESIFISGEISYETIFSICEGQD